MKENLCSEQSTGKGEVIIHSCQEESLYITWIFCLILDINSSDGESSSEGDEMPWQQIWLSSDSDIDYDALRRENNW